MRNDSWGHDLCPLFRGRRCLFVGGWECMECMLLLAGVRSLSIGGKLSTH